MFPSCFPSDSIDCAIPLLPAYDDDGWITEMDAMLKDCSSQSRCVVTGWYAPLSRSLVGTEQLLSLWPEQSSLSIGCADLVLPEEVAFRGPRHAIAVDARQVVHRSVLTKPMRRRRKMAWCLRFGQDHFLSTCCSLCRHLQQECMSRSSQASLVQERVDGSRHVR
jgi:hypothetical protein